ncbi:hypothetical protein EAS64_17470 [Trebonia kvetii]|uniref:Uncharacterized protein n=1 Tax=Trebonia kvetii TaxID=2480626 RepID=A0A6P2C123_9ACTN|nr:hypothetical protein [Trebonia kvetii]TVZ04185.1 hypothetical protein EAS64_17470 [Trebonia kvetii]
MATDFGGAGGQSWRGAQPPYPGEPEFGGTAPPELESPYDPVAVASQRRVRFLAWTALVLGLFGLAGAIPAVMNQAMPRKFTAAQRQQITDWEYAKRWRALTAAAIFPGSVGYSPPATLDDGGSLTLGARRIGIAKEATCAAATDPSAAAILDKDGCATLLAATYADETDSYVLTVGVAVLPSTAQAAAAEQALASAPASHGLGPTVRAVRFVHTPAAAFTGSRRQLSGVLDAGTYVVLYTVGYADPRPREQVAEDRYADDEMMSAGYGVAHAVLSVLASPVPPPHCPGTPGC